MMPIQSSPETCIKGLIDPHDGTVSMPLQITQIALQELIQEQFQKEGLLPLLISSFSTINYKSRGCLTPPRF